MGGVLKQLLELGQRTLVGKHSAFLSPLPSKGPREIRTLVLPPTGWAEASETSARCPPESRG